MASSFRSKNQYQGLAYLDPRWGSSIWTTHSTSLTQAGPRAGTAVAQSDSECVIETSGTQAASSELRLAMQTAGHPGVDGPTYRWRNSGDALWRGWDLPNVLHGVEYCGVPGSSSDSNTWVNRAPVTTLGSTDGGYRWPDILALASGKVLCAYAYHKAIVGNDKQQACVSVRSTAGTWGAATVVRSDDTFGGATPDLDKPPSPALVQLPSGRVLCFVPWWPDGATGNITKINIATYYSDDDGSSWTIANDAAAALDSTAAIMQLRNMRAAYSNGQIVLLLNFGGDPSGVMTYNDVVWQLASDDLGASFTEVWGPEGSAIGEWRHAPCVVPVAGGGFLVGMYEGTASTTGIRPSWWLLGSAYESVSRTADTVGATSGGPADTDGAGNFDSGHLAACIEPSGRAWAFEGRGRVEGGTNELTDITVWYSDDLGATWTRASSVGNADVRSLFTDAGTVGYGHRHISATWHRGRALVAANYASAGTNTDWSVSVLHLGGYTAVTHPAFSPGLGITVRWRQSLHYWAEFTNTAGSGYTHSGGGSRTLTAGTMQYTAAATTFYGYNGLTAGANGLIVEGDIEITSGTDYAGHGLRDGAYGALVEYNGSTVRLYDFHGASTVASVGGLSGKIHVLLTVDGSSATAWYRAESGDEDQEWIQIGTTSSLTSGTSATEHIVGIYNTGTVTARFMYWSLTENNGGTSDDVGEGMYAQANPDDLLGRPLGSAAPQYLADGVSVRGVSGPAFSSDSWNIDTRYDYAAANVLPSVAPSPRTVWRSTGTTAGMALAMQLDANAEDASAMRPVGLLYLQGANFAGFDIEYRAASSWTKLATIDLTKDFAGERRGTTVYATISATDGKYYRAGELVGGAVEFPTGEIRRIVSNTEGHLGVQLNCLRIEIEGTDGTESTSGTFTLWHPGCAILINDFNLTTREGWRIRINNASEPAPPEGYFELGTLYYGQVHVFSTSVSWGRTVTVSPGASLQTYRDGSRRSRADAPTRRALRFGFGASDSRQLHDQAGTLNANAYELHEGVDAVLIPGHGTAEHLRGLIDALGGADSLCVFLPKIEAFTGTEDHQLLELAGPNTGALYGRVTSPLELTSITGDEYTDEVWTVGALTLEEEL